MVKPRDCSGCSYSRLRKGALCYCTLRQEVVPPEEMLAVDQCSLAEAARRKAERLVAEARAARAAKQGEEAPSSQQPWRAVG